MITFVLLALFFYDIRHQVSQIEAIEFFMIIVWVLINIWFIIKRNILFLLVDH